MQNKFPISSFVTIVGDGWTEENHPATHWMKGRAAVVLSYDYERDYQEWQVEIAITKPNGKTILNLWIDEDELTTANRQRELAKV